MEGNDKNPVKDGDSSNNLNEPVAAYESSQQVIFETTDELYEEVIAYWKILPLEKKKVVVELMKNFMEEEDRPLQIPEEEWKIMMKQRADFILGKAKTYTQEEARNILRNPEKRNALLNNR